MALRPHARVFAALALVWALASGWPVAVGAEARPPEPGVTEESSGQDSEATSAAQVTAVVQGFRNHEGQLLLAVFRSDEGFPNDVDQAVFHKAFPIRGGKVVVRISDLEPGVYAIGIHHDEDGDFEMDKGFFGIPREGYGASRDAKARFGPPKFSDAKFEVNEGQELELAIQVQYF